MEKQLKEILNTLYEAEGLLEMALRRGESSYHTLADLARSKCYHAADLAAALNIPAVPAEETSAHGSEDDAEKLFVEKIVPQLDAELAEATENEAEEMAGADPEPDADSAAPVTAEEPETPAPAASAPDDTPVAEEEEAEAEAESALPADNPGDLEIADASIFEVEEEAGDTPAEEAGSSEDFELSEDSEEEDAPQRLLHDRKPIATFFSINDKFRFRRELFANSNPEWLDALALLETMDNLAEAQDYLFDDLQWEADNADVKDFIAVLDRYYRS